MKNIQLGYAKFTPYHVSTQGLNDLVAKNRRPIKVHAQLDETKLTNKNGGINPNERSEAMIQKECQPNYQEVPPNIAELEQIIIKQLKDNEYSLAETRYLFNYILEKIECCAVIGNIK